MTKQTLLLLILAGMFATSPAIAEQATANDSAAPMSAVEMEEARRANLKVQFRDLLDKTIELRNNGQFEDAEKILIQDCEKILAELGDSGTEMRAVLKIYQDELLSIWSQHNVSIADDLITEKKFSDALSHLKRAQEIKGSNYITKRIENIEARLKSIRFDEETSLEYIYPIDHNGRTYRQDELYIQTQLGKMRTLMKERKFQAAIECGEEVYKRHNTNTEVVRLLAQCYDGINRSARSDRFENSKRLLAQVGNRYFPGYPDMPDRDEVAVNPVVEAHTDESTTRAAIEAIRIPRVEFDALPIEQVVQALIDDSREHDLNRKGVNIILRVQNDQAIRDAIPKVTLDVDGLSLLEIIKYVCVQTGLKYKVQPLGSLPTIYIAEDMGKIERQQFALPGSICEKIAAERREKEGDAAGDGPANPIIDESGSGSRRTPSGKIQRNLEMARFVKGYLMDRGVPFPEGSSVVYDDRQLTPLTIRNTETNLEIAANIINELIATEGDDAGGDIMVLIESKFLEVRQTQLEQLGFHWSLTKLVTEAANPNNPGLGEYIEGQGTSQILKADNILNASQTFLSSNPTYIPSQSIFSSTILPNIGPDKNINLNVSITALNQRDLAESLAAPKVTTLPNEEAVLSMVIDEYYPESWDQPRFQNSEIGVTLEPAFPQFGEPTPIGIILRVTPTRLGRDNTIDLTLEPEVTEFTQWSKYYYLVTIPGNNTAQEEEIKMPEISRRSYKTNVTVYDGESVVMGGVIDEKTNVIHAKYPVLGDIPLVGRLFRDYRYYSEKSNLIIFVTARKMETWGVPKRKMENLGVHDYGY